MKPKHLCIECGLPISEGVNDFSQRIYGCGLCMKDQYLFGELEVAAEIIDLYLALKSQKFPVVLGHFDGNRLVDIALPGKLYIEVYETDDPMQFRVLNDIRGSVHTMQDKVPTIMISMATLSNRKNFARLVPELSKACRAVLKPVYEFSVACAPPFTAAQLQ
jgi:hypothetical protein